ncbi:FAD/NAD(P)-binding domain-containing protein [Hypoxylon trugodes]|uniref:FAD/NAD(P)-binding domain-containing protein n=1 Tax=Hypoxylon trugodes TaxID=326681 RepID=UPI0021A05A8D|nr:FAD/NAD(P)-binding domain-containing protein [Hypoxylon trugodes]KAI1392892.1 FAD/NAD(P)-binding domain-containing protein [Hypoxylon trugodes]
MSATSPHLLIAGAGLGGLGLAQSLKKRRINFTIFERDTGPDARNQGYRIKIFPDTVPDLQYLTTPELFAEFEATTAETVMVESSINAVDGHLLARRALKGPKPYTVDRGFLRKVLLRGLEDRIQWGKDGTHYEIDEANRDSPVTVYFADGSTASGTLLVGADGGHSRIRRQHVPNHKIVDPEAICLYGRTSLTPELEQRIQPKLLSGLVVVRDVAPVIQQIIFNSELPISMFVERMHFPHRGLDHLDLPEDYMYWSMLAPSKLVGFTEQAVSSTLNSLTPKELALRLAEEWDDSARCLIEMQDETYATSLRVISSTPDLSDWEPSQYVTLIGDAVHVMSPSGGVGAAMALKDAVALTKALEGPDGGSLDSIKEYESTMRAGAKVAIERSSRGGRVLYGQPPLEDCRVFPLDVL